MYSCLQAAHATTAYPNQFTGSPAQTWVQLFGSVLGVLSAESDVYLPRKGSRKHVHICTVANVTDELSLHLNDTP